MSTRRVRLKPIGAGVVAARPDQVFAWPGMAMTNDNNVLAAASERKFHICPFGRIVLSKSSDGGASWDAPQEIFNSEMDDRHPSLAVMPDGTLICSFLTVNFWMAGDFLIEDWRPRADRVTERLLEEVLGDWLIRSTDGGLTWEGSPHRMPHGGSLHASPYVRTNGSLVCFGYEKERSQVKPYFYESTDKGGSWTRIGRGPEIEPVTGKFAWMPWQLARGGEVLTTPLSMRSIVELAGGHLLALFGGPGGYLWESRSVDSGGNWSKPAQTEIWGFPPHLLRLSSGAILCSYGHRRDPQSIRATLSYDDGKTWDLENTVTIDNWQDKPDMGYPVFTEPTPGELVAVYYVNRKPVAPGKDNRDMKPGSSPEGLLYKRFTFK